MRKVFACAAAVGFFLTGCTGGDSVPTEPVTNESAPSIPDSPGESGESAEKPAGTGEAGTALPASEKSQPNVDAASKVEAPGTTSSVVNVRSGPGMKFEVVKVLKKGEAVNVTECGVVWCKIGDRQYIAKRFLN
jgi:hypothetical protein